MHYLENHLKSLNVFTKSIKDFLYIQGPSVACILWSTCVGNLSLTAPLTQHWCFISWQEVTDLAPGRHCAASQRISVCSQEDGGFQLWAQRCLISLLSETQWPPLLVFDKLKSDEIVLQNIVLKRVFSWRAAQLLLLVSLDLIICRTIQNLLQSAVIVICSIFFQALKTAGYVAQGVFTTSIKSLSSRWGA